MSEEKNKLKRETCNDCGAEKPRSQMKHVQIGFGVVWKCRRGCKKGGRK